MQRPVWDTERRYGETRNPDSPRFSLLLNRTVFTPRKDPLRPPPVLAAYGSQEASGASPRERLSGQVCSRPPKPALLSPRKLVSPDLWPMPHAEPRATRLPSSPSSLHRLLQRYHPLASSTSNGAWGQVQRVREARRIRHPSGATCTSIRGLQPRSGRTGRESELSRLGHSYGRRHASATGRSRPCSFRMEASVANEQRWTSICHSRRSCQHTVPFWCNAH